MCLPGWDLKEREAMLLKVRDEELCDKELPAWIDRGQISSDKAGKGLILRETRRVLSKTGGWAGQLLWVRQVARLPATA